MERDYHEESKRARNPNGEASNWELLEDVKFPGIVSLKLSILAFSFSWKVDYHSTSACYNRNIICKD